MHTCILIFLSSDSQCLSRIQHGSCIYHASGWHLETPNVSKWGKCNPPEFLQLAVSPRDWSCISEGLELGALLWFFSFVKGRRAAARRTGGKLARRALIGTITTWVPIVTLPALGNHVHNHSCLVTYCNMLYIGQALKNTGKPKMVQNAGALIIMGLCVYLLNYLVNQYI